MKKTTKLIAILSSLVILVGIAYGSYTYNDTRYSNGTIQKLPWNGSGWDTNTNHDNDINAKHVGNRAGDSARFTWAVGASKSTTSVVLDNRTGLMWESEPNSGLIEMTWDEAKTHCAGLTKGGFSDWRLPNIRELMSIVDYSRTDGADYWYNSKFTLFANYYWSSTTAATSTGTARFLTFGTASTLTSLKTTTVRVICIR